MVESHLRRKLFSVKQLGGSNISESSSTDWSASSTTNPNFAGSGQVKRGSNIAPNFNKATTMQPSASMPQLQPSRPPVMGVTELIRSNTTDSQEDNEELVVESSSGRKQETQLAAKITSPEEIEGKQETTRRGKKLRAASRAILFFRRAASALKSSTSSNSLRSSSRPANMYDNHLTGLTFQRQSTADSSTPSQVSGRSNYNLSSLFSGHSIGTRLKSSASRSSLSTSNVLDQTQTTSFVVPKLNALKMPLVCLIKSLDGELMREVFVHRYELGQHLFESLKVSIGIEDCKFFGLKLARSLGDQEDLRNPWLDLNESVCKQIKQLSGKGCLLFNYTNHNEQTVASSDNNNAHHPGSGSSPPPSSLRSIDFYLRVKFYPPNLARVQDSFLRHYLWLQLRRDLSLGKLISSMNNLTLLMACVLQYEFGDYNNEFVTNIQSLNILPNQDLIEEQAIELWRSKFVGCRKHQAQMKFLRAAVILETYGFDYYPVRDHQRQRAYLLGFNYAGIKTIRNGRIVHHLRWHSLAKICYERRMIIFHHHPTENSKRKQILGFKCLSNEDCQNLYLRLLEQKYFFTVDLAYFDKSVRRPSCLYAGQTAGNSSQPIASSAGSGPVTSGEASLSQACHWARSATSTTTEEQRECPPSHQKRRASPTTSARFANRTGSRVSLDEELLMCQPERERTDEDFMEDAWLRFRQQHSEHESRPSTTVGHSVADSSSRKQLSWTSKLLNNCRGSGLAELVESVLVAQDEPAGMTPEAPTTYRDNSRPAMVVKQVLKFCLLIMLMNLLFHLCDSFSTFLIRLLPLGAGQSSSSPVEQPASSN